MESLLSIWNRHGKWYDLPHWFRTHESMKAEAESYAVSLATMGEQERVFVARGHIEGLRLLWVEIYAERYGDGANETNLHPATWSTGAAADYLKDYARRVDRHGRGVGLTALQYFAEYVAEALAAFMVAWEQQAASEQRETHVILPMELDTPESKDYFKKAVAFGLMDENYKWRYGLQMLSCFARDMSLHLHLGKGVNADNTERISWKPFETLFKVKPGTLRLNYNDIQKTGQTPKDMHLIDRLFK